MKTIFALLLMTTSAFSQSVNNNTTVNIQGFNQNVSVIQFGAAHSATLNLSGDGITAIISQSGSTPQAFSLSVTCGSNCPSTPYIINQY